MTKNVFNRKQWLTLTFDLQIVISSSSCPGEHLCQISGISVEVFLREHVHKNGRDGQTTWKYKASVSGYRRCGGIIIFRNTCFLLERVDLTLQKQNAWATLQLHGWFMMNPDRGRARTNSLVIEDLGVASVGVLSSQLPHIKERLPVNEVAQTVQVVPFKHTGAQGLRMHWRQRRSTWGPYRETKIKYST